MNYSYSVYYGEGAERRTQSYNNLEDAKSRVKSIVRATKHDKAWIVDSSGTTIYTYAFIDVGFVENDTTGENTMYTVKAIRNGMNEVTINETHDTYLDAKNRAHDLVHGSYRHAVVTRSNGTIAYEISFDGAFHEQEYDTTMNTTSSPSSNYRSRNKIQEIKAVRAITDWGLKESKDWVEARTTEQVAMYIMERVSEATNTLRTKASNYDAVQSSLDLYKKDFNAMVKTLDEKDSHIDTLQKEKSNLLNQRNELLSKLTKEQILDLYIASQSQTE
jgi:ribosomal protein L7/L12